ncbi:E3 ubiquitin-protein like [Actinidia chinensis var. chinensis]|uniref:RING-type E3 ubiquitin transferase n=1 Tax=Actinidia chinensis var. chinensis TaxID=1590841 RepID=A0A2R6QV11_ACTCC|nr:E3 ubiquitin-protein like [Actinidia chinensis var. chinensis]
MMNRWIFLFLLAIFLFLNVEVAESGQSPPSQDDVQSQDAMTNFRPSLGVVIGALAMMFSLTFILLVYAKFCHRASSPVHNNPQSLDGLIRSGSRFSGIDKTVIESLPFFRFASLRGSRAGLECAVCLSKFEDIEILRLLPKCKHAFHIDCVDQWLEKHSSCPLCRHKISAEDLAFLNYSNSLRFLSSQSEAGDESNMELFVQREEDQHQSSRFGSFRRVDRGKKEEELPIQDNCDGSDADADADADDENRKLFHKFNHTIIVSDVVLKNRWSNVSSSDLMFLNSEMLRTISSNRFSSLGLDTEQSLPKCVVEDGKIMSIKEEMERKRDFETKVSKMSQINSFPNNSTSNSNSNPSYVSRALNSNDKRSMSEITVHPRFREFSVKNGISESSLPENDPNEDRLNRLWLPIARRTVQWFANREKTRQSLNV